MPLLPGGSGYQRRDYQLLRLANKLTYSDGDNTLTFSTFWSWKDLDHPIFQVIDQLSRDIAGMLDKSRGIFTELSASSQEMFQEAVETQAGRFRGMLENIIQEETGRVSGLSRELGFLGLDRQEQALGGPHRCVATVVLGPRHVDMDLVLGVHWWGLQTAPGRLDPVRDLLRGHERCADSRKGSISLLGLPG